MENAMYYKMLIDGEEVEATDGSRFEVVNPANEEVVGSTPRGGAADADKALQSAEKAFKSWRNVPAAKRAEYSVASNFVICPIPLLPETTAFHVSSRLFPTGVIKPIPETTTLRVIGHLALNVDNNGKDYSVMRRHAFPDNRSPLRQ